MNTKPATLYPYWQIILGCLLFSPIGAYLIVYKTVEKLNNYQLTKKYLVVGGLVILLYEFLFEIAYSTYTKQGDFNMLKNVVYLFSLGYGVWYALLIKNNEEYKNIATKFDIKLYIWGILGLIITLIVGFFKFLIFNN